MGVRIQELPATSGIKKEDVLIVEDGQGTKKGTVQQLDETLGVSQLKEDLDNVADFTKLSNKLTDVSVSTLNFDSTNVSLRLPCSGVTLVKDKTYVVYCDVDISNLTGYTYGNVYLQLFNAHDLICENKYAGTNEQLFKNGNIELYGLVTAPSDGLDNLYITTRNLNTNFTCNVTVNKLYVLEYDNLSVLDIIRNNQFQDVLEDVKIKRNIVNEDAIIDKSITYDKLSEDIQNLFPISKENVIDCWGDSLTAGAGSINYSYPKKLQELVGDSFTVNNYGQGAEVAEAIAFRQGGLNALIGAFTPSTSYVENEMLVSVNGKDLLPTLNYQGTYYGNNVVYIGSTPYMYRRIDNKCMLACISGNVPSAYTRPMMIRAEGKGTKHIIIICVGQNGWTNTDNRTLADIIANMIEHNNYDKYIVVGIPSGSKSSKEEQEKVLSSCFGNHFVNTREYISAYGLSDSNLTPTEEDTSAMSEGQIPPQLRFDTVHMNDYGYIAMANCIYQRGVSLGYW